MPYSDLDKKGGIVPVGIIVAVVAAVAFMMGFAIWASTSVRAHGGYPISCCSDRDCAPADERVKDVPGGFQVQGHGFIATNDSRVQKPLDAEAHVCESPSKKLLCLFPRFGSS